MTPRHHVGTETPFALTPQQLLMHMATAAAPFVARASGGDGQPDSRVPELRTPGGGGGAAAGCGAQSSGGASMSGDASRRGTTTTTTPQPSSATQLSGRVATFPWGGEGVAAATDDVAERRHGEGGTTAVRRFDRIGELSSLT